MNKSTRDEVITALNGERQYQEMRVEHSPSDGNHTIGDFVVFMDDYMREAKEKLTRVWGPDGGNAALDVLRKITALGIACLEKHGVVAREDWPGTPLDFDVVGEQPPVQPAPTTGPFPPEPAMTHGTDCQCDLCYLPF